MISDEKLRALVEITAIDVEKDEFASSSMRSTLVHKLCAELLERREAERKAKSWDDTEACVQTRRKVTEFYPFARKALSFRAGMDSARTIVS
jgi:hypothetical protein